MSSPFPSALHSCACEHWPRRCSEHVSTLRGAHELDGRREAVEGVRRGHAKAQPGELRLPEGAIGLEAIAERCRR
jgi:hypothetical protein